MVCQPQCALCSDLLRVCNHCKRLIKHSNSKTSQCTINNTCIYKLFINEYITELSMSEFKGFCLVLCIDTILWTLKQNHFRAVVLSTDFIQD